MEVELVDFEDRQDKQLEQQEDDNDSPDSHKSFGTKVGKITRGSLREKGGKHDKSNKSEAVVEEPRRRPRLKN
jgi:hypothetical protein